MITYYLNGQQRNTSTIKVMFPRTIQKEAIDRITNTVKNGSKLLVNMPCRTGKTFTTLYSAYHAGIELVIVLCGKASAKASYVSDSAWINTNGEVEGFNKVFVKNSAVKAFLKTADVQPGDKILIEVTPQLLNKNKDLVAKLADLAGTMKALFAFDEAHFTEQTDKTKEMVKTITDDEAVNTDDLQDFRIIPWVYLTASPDTQSLMNVFSMDNGNYYELTKEREWELYLEDLEKPVEEREFNYVPVRNCLYVMDRVFDSVFNSATSKKQDYTSLFTQNTAARAASKFVLKTLTKTIQVINAGPEKSFMAEDTTAPYVRRGSNINLMIKVPVNSSKTNTSGQTVAKRVIQFIKDNEQEILATYPSFDSIEILDVTLSNNTSQDQANSFFDEHPTSINIILTQQRLIEGTTLYNLDGFLYYCNSGSLPKYKQESGRTLTPSANKRFGFIFFFDEDALANVKAILRAKLNKIKGNKKHGPRKLTDEQAKRMTRINPAFIIGSNDEMKLVDYSQSLLTKTDLEKTRVKNDLFDTCRLLAIPGLKDLIISLLSKMSNNTTRATKKGNSSSSVDGNSRAPSKVAGSKALDPTTPIDQIETEKFVNTIIYMYQDCIQNDVTVDSLSVDLQVESEVNGLSAKALELLYNNEYTYDVLMEIYDVLKNDQDTINSEV
jgi:hypothetical protein